METKVKLGLLGCGNQLRQEYLPYLEKRIQEKNDIEMSWISGCQCTEGERSGCPLKAKGFQAAGEPGHENDWRLFLVDRPVDGILVSLPNFLHAEPIREALEHGVSVVVDKPTTIRSEECAELVTLAERKKLVFVTISQRRYETVYETVVDIIKTGGLGEPRLINYMIAHENFDRGKTNWRTNRQMAGGGALIASGYHGIDTILWLLKQGQPAVTPISVLAARMLDTSNPSSDAPIESLAAVIIRLSNSGIFNTIASYENPIGSLDENIKMFGRNGTIRIMRDRLQKLDQSAANLSYQQIGGNCTVYDTRGWTGKRWAPLKDFIDAVHAKKKDEPWSVLSPASDSIQTIKVIEKAYESAQHNGQEMQL